MTRNFGITSEAASGGIRQPPRSHSALHSAELIPFPSGSYRAPDEPFESLKIKPSLFEVAGLACTLFFGCALGVSFFAALYILIASPL
jgi:hypothetical protein